MTPEEEKLARVAGMLVCDACGGRGTLLQDNGITERVACGRCRGFGAVVDKFERLRAKCSAIIMADMAKRSGQVDEARRQFQVAASFEHEIVVELAKAGRDCTVNAISEASCWLEAGDHQRAREAAVRGLEDGKRRAGLGQELALEFERVLDACERVLGPCPTRGVDSAP